MRLLRVRGIGGHGNAGLVEALQGALSMEFGGMKHHHRCVLRRFTQRLEQPRREAFPDGTYSELTNALWSILARLP